MPVAAGPQLYQTQFSPFTKSIFRDDTICVEDEPGRIDLTEKVHPPIRHCSTISPVIELSHEALVSSSLHLPQHRGSITSCSTDSSPTTTVSTVDSSSIAGTSPSSSPASRMPIVPLSSFSNSDFSNSMDNLVGLSMNEKLVSGQRSHLTVERPMTSPAPRRPRNAKGLALHLPSNGRNSPEQIDCSLVTSPTFVKPPTMKPRKKPSILSLQTIGNSRPTRLSLDPPPTPSGANPMLRHHHSSPQIMASPRLPPNGGMNFPNFERSKASGLSSTFRKPTGLSQSSSMNDGFSIEEESDYIRPQMASRSGAVTGGDPFDKGPGSQEMDSHFNDYNEGPVLMHAPSLYLYKEPTAEEAMDFDVIINVAAEVLNPFDKSIVEHRRRSTLPYIARDFTELDVPTPGSVASFQTALEWPSKKQSTILDTPTTPRPADTKPEYIHVRWEHNSTIAKDLMGLCELIDKRTKAGKKVLVHCLQGISRSASLIIAYGIYLNPEMSVTQAHEEAKQKSEWITPNMKLIFQIQEFQGTLQAARPTGRGVLNKRLAGRGSSRHRNTLSADVEALTKEPLTAPLPSDKEKPGDTSHETASRPRGLSTPFPSIYSPGPSSAPSVFGWSRESPTTSGFRFGTPHLAVPTTTTSLTIDGSAPGSKTLPGTLTNGQQEPTTDDVASIMSEEQTITPSRFHGKSDSLAAFDFGFGKSTSATTDEIRHQEISVTPPADVLMDTPVLPGSFPRSPDCESQSHSAELSELANSRGFSAHRIKSMRPRGLATIADNTAKPRLILDDAVTLIPPSPGLFSPRSQEPSVHSLNDSLAIQQSRAEGPKKEGFSMYNMSLSENGVGLGSHALNSFSGWPGSGSS